MVVSKERESSTMKMPSGNTVSTPSARIGREIVGKATAKDERTFTLQYQFICLPSRCPLSLSLSHTTRYLRYGKERGVLSEELSNILHLECLPESMCANTCTEMYQRHAIVDERKTYLLLGCIGCLLQLLPQCFSPLDEEERN
jgi:hypothetical protein